MKYRSKKKIKKGGTYENQINNTELFECTNCGKYILFDESIICEDCNTSVYCSQDCKDYNYTIEHHYLCELYKKLLSTEIGNITPEEYEIIVKKGLILPEEREYLINDYINNDIVKLRTTYLYTIGNYQFSIPSIYRINIELTSNKLQENYPNIKFLEIREKMRTMKLSQNIITNNPEIYNGIDPNKYICSYWPHQKILKHIYNYIQKCSSKTNRNIKILEIGCGCGAWGYF